MTSVPSDIWQLRQGDRDYPQCVAQLDDRAPEVLYGLGCRDLVAGIDPNEAVTIVGSRRSGTYGRGVAHELGHGAAAAGLVVVSGMALGCDSAAHEGALAAGGRTIAVLGNGPDVVYPPSRADLYRRILADGGAVVAEQPPGRRAAAHFFPARNRIMAALTAVTVVVEGAVRSGTRHTVDEAAGLGREVGAVPGPVNSALSELPNELIRDGVRLIRDAQDLLDLALGVGVVSVRGVGPELDEELVGVLGAVEGGAATCDAVALEIGAAAGRAAVALARLELLGYVETDPIGRYERTRLNLPASTT